MINLCVFASGSGTNFVAINESINNRSLKAKMVLVVCDNKNAPVIKKAEASGIEVFSFNPKEFACKADFEKLIVTKLQEHGVDLIALAGYMRIIGDTLLDAYEGKIINIHPSLLPAFQGKDAIMQAINYGVKVMGVSIHYVDHGLDSGKIIAQEAFKVDEGMTCEEIEKSIHAIEHKLYSSTIKKLIEGEEK